MFYDKKRIEELTQEVENHLTFMGTVDNKKRLMVDKNLFLETLPDVRTYVEDGNTILHLGFLNKYINSAFYNSYKRVKDLISLEDYFQIVYLKVATHVEELEGERIHISFKDKEQSDINYIAYKIDKECVSEVFEQSDIVYERGKVNQYLPKFGDPISIDNTLVDIGDEEVIRPPDEEEGSLEEGKYDYIEEVLQGVKLTEKQKEVLYVMGYCDNNIRETGRVLGITPMGVINHLEGVRKKVENNKKLQEKEKEHKPKRKTIDKLEKLLEDKNFDEEMLLNFIIKNIEDKDISYIVYEIENEERKKIFNYINKDKKNLENILPIESIDFKPFLNNFLKIYYNSY